jgi:hypothetical protein
MRLWNAWAESASPDPTDDYIARGNRVIELRPLAGFLMTPADASSRMTRRRQMRVMPRPAH